MEKDFNVSVKGRDPCQQLESMQGDIHLNLLPLVIALLVKGPVHCIIESVHRQYGFYGCNMYHQFLGYEDALNPLLQSTDQFKGAFNQILFYQIEIKETM